MGKACVGFFRQIAKLNNKNVLQSYSSRVCCHERSEHFKIQNSVKRNKPNGEGRSLQFRIENLQ